MAEIVIDSASFFAYSGEDEADEYLAGSMKAAEWAAAKAAGTTAPALITGARILDRQRWMGSPVEADQEHAFPRTGLTYYDGTAVSEADTPLQVGYANIELALLLVLGEEIESVQNTAQKLASLSAGSVSLSFFRGAEGLTQRFPPQIMELIGQWLLSSQTLGGGAFSSGIDGETSFDETLGPTRGL